MRVIDRGLARYGITLMLAASFGAAVAGCGGSSGATTSGATGASGSESPAGKSVYIISCGEEVPYCKTYNETMKTKFEAAGLNVTVLTDEYEPAEQNRHIDNAISRHADAIVLLPDNGSANAPAVERAEAAGVKVVNTDAPLVGPAEDAPSLNVIEPHGDFGRWGAEELVKGLEEEGKKSANIIVASGAFGTPPVEEDLAGFKEVMKKHPQYKVVAVDDTGWDQNKAMQMAAQRLAQYASSGGIQGAYGMNDLLALGVVKAAEQAGVPVGVEAGGLVVTSGACQTPGVAAVKKGTLVSSARHTPVPEGEAVADATIRLLEGKSQPKTVRIKNNKITKQNIGRFEGVCTY